MWNMKNIMKKAWEIKKQDKRNIFSECLKMAWAIAKDSIKPIFEFGGVKEWFLLKTLSNEELTAYRTGTPYVARETEKAVLIKNDDYKSRLMKAFHRKQDRYTKYRVVPRYVSPVDVQALQEIDTKDIIDAVRHSGSFRLRNLASAVPSDRNPHDRLVIETIPVVGQTAYGCCIDRGSSVTIVAPSAAGEVAMGNFAYYMALYGGFNYVSKERDEDSDAPRSYYLVDDDMTAVERQYVDDIRRVARGGWVVFVIAADSVHPEAFHFVTAIQPKLNAGTSTVIDRQRFDELYEKLSADMAASYGLGSERDTRYLPVGKKNATMRIGAGRDCNAFTLRVDWTVAAFDDRYIAIADTLARDIASVLTPDRDVTPDPSLKSSGFGY